MYGAICVPGDSGFTDRFTVNALRASGLQLWSLPAAM
jgi:hypothetical protein